MTGAFLILLFIVVVGIVLYIFELRYRRRHANAPEQPPSSVEPETARTALSSEEPADGEAPSVCCGQHLVCEKDSLSPTTADIVYYDDEELDRFAGRDASDYTPEEEEEFREVLMTLRPEDAPGWARSITQRHLALPADVRDALLMMVNELRGK